MTHLRVLTTEHPHDPRPRRLRTVLQAAQGADALRQSAAQDRQAASQVGRGSSPFRPTTGSRSGTPWSNTSTSSTPSSEKNPYKLDPDELDIVRSWKDLVAGEFYVLRFLKKYTVFLTAKEPTVAYGVVALSEPFEEVIDQPLPFLCKTVLLPFQGRIVYDGLLSGYNLIIGSNIRRELNDAYNAAKKRHGIVTSLPWRAETPKAVPKRGIVQKKRGKRGSGLIGRWRITWMETWKQDYVDEEVEGFFKFDPDGTGKFQFYCVKGGIDYREVKRDGKPAVEFSWDGHDGEVPASGRGWANH